MQGWFSTDKRLLEEAAFRIRLRFWSLEAQTRQAGFLWKNVDWVTLSEGEGDDKSL